MKRMRHAWLVVTLATGGLCWARPDHVRTSLTERVTAEIVRAEPSWTVRTALRPTIAVVPTVSGMWEGAGCTIDVSLAAYPTGEEATSRLARARRYDSQSSLSPTHALRHFRKANVLVWIQVSRNRGGEAPSTALAKGSAATIADRAGQIVGDLIASEVRADGCVNELFSSPSPDSPRDAFLLDVSSGCAARVKEALRAGADANQRDRNGTTALRLAATRGHLNVVKLLLDAGADPAMQVGRRGPATFAILSRPSAYFQENLPGILENQIAILDELLDRGAEIDARDDDGRTLLMETARFNADDGSPVVYLKALLERGADPSARDKEGRTATIHAVTVTSPDVAATTLPTLLAAGSDVNAQDASGKTAIAYARQRAVASPDLKWPEVLRLLVEKGAKE